MTVAARISQADVERGRAYEPIAKKFRRALRNGTGATFTLEQLEHMAEAGILQYLAKLESDELCKSRSLNMAGSGSATGATARPPVSGRSHGANVGPSFIDQLGYEM